MPNQDIIVVGASAGGVEALQVLARGLPADLNAAVFVVLHIGNGINGHSYLSEIVSQAGLLPASQAKNDESIEPGRIYIACPNLHLTLEPGRMCVVNGPKENLARPAIDPLFRSAAAAYGQRVAGVIMTGMLDDGVAGLAEIKRHGGVAIVQNPATALFPSMPLEALKYVDVDYVLELEEIAGMLAYLTVTERTAEEITESMTRKLVKLTCPECRGPLWEERQGKIVGYRCRVGHAYSPLALLEEHRTTLERTVWSTIVALEEAAEIDEQMASELGENVAEDAISKREQADTLRKMLEDIKSR